MTYDITTYLPALAERLHQSSITGTDLYAEAEAAIKGTMAAITLLKEARDVLGDHWFDGEHNNEDVIAVCRKIDKLLLGANMESEKVVVDRADLVALRSIVQTLGDNAVRINGILIKANNDIGQLILPPIVPAFPILDKYLKP